MVTLVAIGDGALKSSADLPVPDPLAALVGCRPESRQGLTRQGSSQRVYSSRSRGLDGQNLTHSDVPSDPSVTMCSLRAATTHLGACIV
jgi:hypothetical protein